MKRILSLLALALPLLAALPAAAQTRLLRFPDASDTQIVFSYGGDLWIVDRDGGDARRLTSDVGREGSARFSPDGTQVAFDAQYDGNTDVYVVSVSGGEPRRLTWHPGLDFVRGWTPDGSGVVFASGRDTAPVNFPRFWIVPVEGGMPSPMPMPRAWFGRHSPDGSRFAYEPILSWETEWRNYRGGQNRPIWLLDLDDLSLEKLPWEDSNDGQPVWIGDTIYFLSDRDWAMNVWAYDTGTGELGQLTRFKEYDVKNLEAGGGWLVFEQAGFIHRLDPATGETVQVPIEVRGDFSWARPHWEEVVELVREARLSPSGKRALFEARGEIFTVPAEKGEARNLTRSSGVAERAPAWSPDGRWISWFSDESGEYQLVIADQLGQNRRVIELAEPTFFYTPAWSPDSKYLSFGDADRNLWLLEVESGERRLIDDEGFAIPGRVIYPAWSPDSRWIAYTRRLPSQFAAIFVYDVETGERHAVTDGLSDSRAPAWDAGGKYLYFLASTDYGINVGWLDMSNYDRPVTRAVYAAVLAADEPSPLEPESDEEEVDGEDGEDEDENGDDEDEVDVPIDFDGLARRIIALDIPEGEYIGLEAAGEGVLFYGEAMDDEPGFRLHRWDMEERESQPFLEGIVEAVISADGEKLLYGTPDDSWGIVETAGEPSLGDGALAVSELRSKVEPAAEWAQIFREAWRFQRDYFYVDNVHGLDLDEVWEKYSPWLEHVRHRTDLSHLLDILGGETAIGHSFTFGGDNPDVEQVPVGLLGADLEVADGRYRIARIYRGESWNPELRAPLSGPGIAASEGDYLLAVDGVELSAADNPYSLFDRTADRQTVLTLGAEPSFDEAREVTVVPIADETSLRRREWVDSNRRRVDELSDGRLAYVWLPNTATLGYAAFNRY